MMWTKKSEIITLMAIYNLYCVYILGMGRYTYLPIRYYHITWVPIRYALRFFLRISIIQALRFDIAGLQGFWVWLFDQAQETFAGVLSWLADWYVIIF